MARPAAGPTSRLTERLQQGSWEVPAAGGLEAAGSHFPAHLILASVPGRLLVLGKPWAATFSHSCVFSKNDISPYVNGFTLSMCREFTGTFWSLLIGVEVYETTEPLLSKPESPGSVLRVGHSHHSIKILIYGSGCSYEIHVQATLSSPLSSVSGGTRKCLQSDHWVEARTCGTVDSTSARITKLYASARLTWRPSSITTLVTTPRCRCETDHPRREGSETLWYRNSGISGWLASPSLELKLPCFSPDVSILSLTWKHSGLMGVLKICTWQDLSTLVRFIITGEEFRKYTFQHEQFSKESYN